MRPGKDRDTSFSFPKRYRVNSKIVFQDLMKNKTSLSLYLFKCYYKYYPLSENENWNSIAISVPKRIFKKATDRNRIKRMVREAYRQNHHQLLDAQTVDINRRLVLLFVYVYPKIESYQIVEEQVKIALKSIVLPKKEYHETN